jgi:hypothetical protein
MLFNFLLPVVIPFFTNCSDLSEKNQMSQHHGLTSLPNNNFHILTKTLYTETETKSPETKTHYSTITHTINPTVTSEYEPKETFTSTISSVIPVETQNIRSINTDSSFTNTIATYYFRVGNDVDGCVPVQNFNDGNSYGPCNNYQGVKYTSESKYWVAIANAQQHCGKDIEIVYNGNSMRFKVMDNCPACASDNHVDMSLDALIELTGSKENACAINKGLPNISWRFV